MSAPLSRLPSTQRPAGGAGRSRPVSMIEPGFTAPQPTLDTTTSRAMKRRSLLPQFSRTTSAEHPDGDLDSVGQNAEGTIDEQDYGERVAEQSRDRSPRETHFADQRAMPPPSTRMARPRPMSMMIPSTAGTQLGRTASTRAHARTQSKESNTSNSSNTPSARLPPQDSGHTRTSSIRAPAGLTRTSSIRAPQPSVPKRGSSAVSSASSLAAKRVSTVAPPVQTSSSSALSPRKPLSTRAPGPRSQLAPPKPSFTTYQQHFSPAKSALPKPHLSQHIQPSPTPASQLDPDSARQSLHLLHLSLLYTASASTTASYITSAHRKLSAQHTRLRTALLTLREKEAAHKRTANLSALQTWSPEPTALISNLQTLGQIHRDLTALLSTRYAELTAQFDAWLDSALASSSSTASFVLPLPQRWRDGYTSTSLQIRALQRALASLPPLARVVAEEGHAPEEGGEATGLGRLLAACRRLVEGTLQELEMMRGIEGRVLEGEGEKVRDRLKGVLGEGETDREREAWVPVWETVG